MKKEVIFIFLIALIARLAFLAFYDVRMRKDAISYDRVARSLAKGNGYVWPDGSATAHRPPIYPFFLSIIYRLFGYDYRIVKVIQCTLGAMSCILIYLVARGIFSKNVGFLAGFLASLHVGFVAISRLLLSENLTIFFLSLLLLCLVNALRKDSCLLLAISGVLLGIIALTSSIMVLLMPVIAVAVVSVWKKEDLKRRFIMGLVVILTAFFTIVPWTVRNCIVFRSFVPLTTQLGESLYAAYNPKDGKIFGFMAHNDPTLDYSIENFDKVQRSRFMLIKTLKYIRENPQKALRLLPLKIMFFFSPFDWEILGTKGLYNFTYGFIFPFFVAGLSCLRRRGSDTLMLILPFFYLLVISLFFYGSPRFRLPAEIVMVILASYSMVHLFLKRLGLYRGILVLSGWACVNIAFFIFSDGLKYLSRTLLEGVGLW